jgi:arylsulfatase A-like enzyme
VRTREWKYTVYPFPDRKSRRFLTAELYDLKNDPKELNNLINDPNCADTAEQMVKELEKLKVQTAFRFP